MGRVRLRTLIANANRTVNQASGEIQRTSNNANGLIDYLEAFMAEVEDGLTLHIVRQGEGSVMDFVMGKIDKLPIGIRVEFKEGDEEKS